jgi:uncharacterized protein YlxW (UPF0749 family)
MEQRDDQGRRAPIWSRTLRSRAAGPRGNIWWRAAAPVAVALAGLLFVTSAINANGTDLRGGRFNDLASLVQARSAEVNDLRAQAAALQASIDQLAGQVDDQRVAQLRRQLARMQPEVGLTPVSGPGLSVTLDDAPRNQVVPPAIGANALVVHQQDIQAVVNALWAGGAEAMSLQGQRIIATTGIKCVGNTVVLHGVPYSPPYRIVAIGNQATMQAGLNASDYIDNYKQYVVRFGLGYMVVPLARVELPAYAESPDLNYAHAIQAPETQGSSGNR